MKKILDTNLVQINETESEYQVLIRMSQGGVIEHEPFPKDLRGLIAAMQLSTEVLAGKFFPKRIFEVTSRSKLEYVPFKITKEDA